MPIQVIGAGYPRTGTASLKVALEQLGVGPCYHMSECLNTPNHWLVWQRAADRDAIDWDEIFRGYSATTDIPGCHFVEELATKYPQAKVILTVRDPQSWFASTQTTILSRDLIRRFAAAPSELNAMMRRLDWHPAEASTHDRVKMIARITAHNESVIRAIPPPRLLIFAPEQGWGPLCAFLGMRIPDSPFPRINSSRDFQRMMTTVVGLGPGGVKQALVEQRSRR